MTWPDLDFDRELWACPRDLVKSGRSWLSRRQARCDPIDRMVAFF
jgi:hypothetical protein